MVTKMKDFNAYLKSHQDIFSKANLMDESRTLTTIVCMNRTESKYYVYTQTGILINRVAYMDETRYHGEMVAGSNNAQNYIFQKKNIEFTLESFK